MAEVASVMTVTNIWIQYQQRISVTVVVTYCRLEQRIGCSLGFHGGGYGDGGSRVRPRS
jgi:hypothetical protein